MGIIQTERIPADVSSSLAAATLGFIQSLMDDPETRAILLEQIEREETPYGDERE